MGSASGGVSASEGRSASGGVYLQGRLPPGGLGRPPSQSQLKKRAVRILLECFLVKNTNSFQCASKAKKRTRKNNLLRLTVSSALLPVGQVAMRGNFRLPAQVLISVT